MSIPIFTATHGTEGPEGGMEESDGMGMTNGTLRNSK